MHELEIETMPGVILGHRHFPVASVGATFRWAISDVWIGSMSIIPAKVAGVKTIAACTPPVKGRGISCDDHAIANAGADRIFILGGVQAFALMAFGMGAVAPADILCGAGNKFVAEANVVIRPLRYRPSRRPDRDRYNRGRYVGSSGCRVRCAGQLNMIL